MSSKTKLSAAAFSAALLFFSTSISFAATVTIKKLPSVACGGTNIIKLPSATGGVPATIVSLPTDVVCACGACSATGGCAGKCSLQPGTDACGACTADCGSCAVCGDGTCNGAENCSNCPADCGGCPYCGDGICNNGETCSSCSDCPGSCGPGQIEYSDSGCRGCGTNCYMKSRTCGTNCEWGDFGGCGNYEGGDCHNDQYPCSYGDACWGNYTGPTC